MVIVPLLAAVLTAAGAVAVVLFRTSAATRIATVTVPDNPWKTGVVALSSPGRGTALFDAGSDRPLTGGTATARCVTVVYTGTVKATVTMYGRVDGALAEYLDLAIHQGSGGSNGDCVGFVATRPVYTGTVAAFGATSTGFESGVGAWTPSGAGATIAYRITVTVRRDNAAQGRTANAGFTWEAHA
jgi:hypothetical protein